MLHTSQVLTINEIKRVWQKKKEKEKEQQFLWWDNRKKIGKNTAYKVISTKKKITKKQLHFIFVAFYSGYQWKNKTPEKN